MKDGDTTKFLNVNYLLAGNQRQKQAHQLLIETRILDVLASFSPVLAGTIPLAIDIEGSDLDILCQYKDLLSFKVTVENSFSVYPEFTIREKVIRSHKSVIANFNVRNFAVEIFGQDIPVTQQDGYRHMVVEHQILTNKGELFRNAIIDLKKSGVKTEPAFAQLLNLQGDPYEALLKYRVED